MYKRMPPLRQASQFPLFGIESCSYIACSPTEQLQQTANNHHTHPFLKMMFFNRRRLAAALALTALVSTSADAMSTREEATGLGMDDVATLEVAVPEVENNAAPLVNLEEVAPVQDQVAPVTGNRIITSVRASRW